MTVFDKTDFDILGYLTENARITNQEIASKLGLAEGTIRVRIRNMIDDKSIRFTAITRELDVENPTLCFVGLRIDLPKLTSSVNELAQFPEIRFVATTVGRYDALAIVVVDSVEALSKLVGERFMSIDGVRRTYSSVVTKTLKYDYRWGRVI